MCTYENLGQKYLFPKFSIVLDKRTYTFSKLIHGGTTKQDTSVSLYTDGDNEAQLVVKTLSHDEGTRELWAIRKVNEVRKTIGPAMVRAMILQEAEQDHTHPLTPANYSVVIMPYRGQPLTRLDAQSRRLSILVTQAVFRAIHQLFNHGLAYTDIKSMNVVHLITPDGKTHLTLCDYGSIEEVGASTGCATYPPPESPYGTGVVADERALCYGVGVLLATLSEPLVEKNLRYMDKPVGKKRKTRSELPASDQMHKQCKKTLEVLEAKDHLVADLVRFAWETTTSLSDLGGALKFAIRGLRPRGAFGPP